MNNRSLVALALVGLCSLGCRTANVDGAAGSGGAAARGSGPSERAVRVPFVLSLAPAPTAAVEPDVLRLVARVERPADAETALSLEAEIVTPPGATRDCGSPAAVAAACEAPTVSFSPGQTLVEFPVVVRGAAAVSVSSPVVVRVSLPKNAAFGASAERHYPEPPHASDSVPSAGSTRTLGGLPIAAPVPTTRVDAPAEKSPAVP